jgi:hypothetical protein
MNVYTPNQLKSLFKFIVEEKSMPYYVIKLFISDESNFIENDVKVCIDSQIVYDRLINFKHTKINGNYPNHNQKSILKKTLDILFNIALNKVPLYINEEGVKPLVIWRLKNKI